MCAAEVILIVGLVIHQIDPIRVFDEEEKIHQQAADCGACYPSLTRSSGHNPLRASPRHARSFYRRDVLQALHSGPNGWVGGQTRQAFAQLPAGQANCRRDGRRALYRGEGPREGTAGLWTRRAVGRRSAVRLARMVARKSQVLKNFRDRKQGMKVISTPGWVCIS